jgi:sigma-B regulation protein RsbU (phosphoserine phosphatase)
MVAQVAKRLRAFTLNNIFGIVLIGANFAAVLCISQMYPYIRTEADMDTLSQALEGSGWLTLAYFLIPMALATTYYRPVAHPLDIRDPTPRQKRRLLNAPLVMSLIGMTGWATAVVSLFPMAAINNVSLQLGAVIRYTLDMMFAASVVFVITYYILDLVNRRYFVPLFFPDGELSKCEGAISLSIRTRFYIYFFAAAGFPVFLFYNVILAAQASNGPRDLALPMTVLMVAVVALGAFVTYLVAKAYQTPLNDIERATQKIRGGDFEVKVAVVADDEVGHLGEAVNEMAVGLKERDLIKAAHERVTHELAVAWRIQREFLPDHLPQVPGWQMAATLEPAKQTSGDFYDCFAMPDGRLGLIVADVTDKGVGAALYMALSRTLLRTYATEYLCEPEKAFVAAHRRILADTNTSQFVTVFYGVLDPDSGTMTYSNAGHNPPYLIHGNGSGDAANGGVKELPNTGPPVGLRMFENLTWGRDSVQLGPGDLLVLYSDGITEAENAQEDLFAEERLLQVVQANAGASAEAVQNAIITAVRRFVGAAPQSDDMTLMVLARR